MPVVFASGCLGPPLTVVKGKKLIYRVVMEGNRERIETVADFLPENRLISCREDVASVDGTNFYEWAERFV